MNAVRQLFDLSGKVVLLTGGAGLYGRGLASDLADAGATLVIASRNLAMCEEVARQERTRGREVNAESFDQGDERSIQDLLARILQKFGRIDGLVNNSVVRSMGPDRSFLDGCEESMRVNATGIILMHHHFGNQMALQKSGSIVNIGSIQGMVGPDLHLYDDTSMPVPTPDYFFHKGGMLNLTRYYSGLLGVHGVRTNCLSPGGFYNQQPEAFVRRYEKKTYLGRMSDTRDLGGPLVFLLSEASRYITGVNLPVDGGYTAN